MNKLDIEAPPGEDIQKILENRRKSWMKSKKFEEQLESDKIQADVLKEVIKEAQEDEHQSSRFQEFLDRILQYTPLQVVLLVLAIIDVAIVVSEILVTLHVYDIERTDSNSALKHVITFITHTLQLEGDYYLHDVINVLNRTLQSCNLNLSKVIWHREDADLHDAQDLILPKLFYNPYMIDRPSRLLRIKRSSDEEMEIPENGLPENSATEQLHIVEDALNITSIVILGIFVVVAIMKIIADGKHFFTQIMEVIDAIVVTLSFILDIVKYTGALNKDATEATIVLLLLWQIVRMFNGIMLSELKRLEFRIKLLKRTRKRVESKLSTTTSKMKLLEKEIDGLKKLCRLKGALEEEIIVCRPSTMTGKPSALAGLSCIASMSVGLSISTPLAVDLKEQRQNLLQSLSKVSRGSFTSSPSETGGLSLVAMFPSDEGSSNAAETEESTADAEPSSPSKKVTFAGNQDDDNNNNNNNNSKNNDNSDGNNSEDGDNNDIGKNVMTRQDSFDCDDVFEIVTKKPQTKLKTLPHTQV